ncbi:MAG: hypothetical protein Q4D21_03095 [Phascolarctobacterium sp.]|nr:hypothetical protein [Phascolarctobacterium sp.]
MDKIPMNENTVIAIAIATAGTPVVVVGYTVYKIYKYLKGD